MRGSFVFHLLAPWIVLSGFDTFGAVDRFYDTFRLAVACLVIATALGTSLTLA